MIPDFDERGYMPPGIHIASLDEVEARFGRDAEIRCAQMDSLRWLVELVQRSGAERLIVNGSFVTDVVEPNDVDCVLLIGPEFPLDPTAETELREGLPFIESALVEQVAFDQFVERIFATDRDETIRAFTPSGPPESSRTACRRSRAAVDPAFL